MASKKELAIEYKAINNGFNSELKEISGEVTTLTKTFKLQQEQMKNTASSTDKLKSNLGNLKNNLELAKKKTEATNKAYENAVRLMGENSKEAQAWKNKLLDAQRSEQYLQNAIDDTNEQIKEQTSLAKNLGKGLSEAGDKLQDAGDKISNVGEGMSTKVTAPILGVGAAAYAAWGEYDDAIDGIIKATGASGDAIEDMEGVYKNVYKSLPVESADVAAAIGELNTQFGTTGKVLEDSTATMLKFAEITGGDVVSSTQGAKKAMSLYGMEADELDSVLDVVAKTSQDTGVATDKLFDAVQKGAPQLKSMGLDFAESTTLMGQFEKSGIDSGKALSYMAKAQVTFAKDGKSLTEGLAELESKLGDTTSETDKLTLMAKYFGTKGAGVMLEAIDTGAMSFDDLAKASENASGTVNQTFEDTLDPADNFKVAFNNAKQAMSDLGDVIQNMVGPYLEKLTTKIKEISAWFQGLSEDQQQMIVKIGLLVAAIGPALVVIGKVVSMFGSISSGLGTVSTALAGLSAPIVAAVAVIAALVAAFVYLWQTNEDFRNKIIEIWNNVKETFDKFVNGIKERLGGMGVEFNDFGELAKKIWDGFANFLGPLFEGVFNNLALYFEFFVNTFLGVWDFFSALFSGDWEGMWDAVESIFTGLWDFIKGYWENIWNTLKNMGTQFLSWFDTDWEGLWKSVKEFFVNTWSGIKEKFTTFTTNLKTAASNAWTSIKTKVTEIWTSIKDFFVGIWDGIKTSIQTRIDLVKSVVTTVFESVRTKVSEIWEGIKTKIITPINDAKTKVSNTVTGIRDKLSAIWDGIKTKVTNTWDSIKSAIVTPIESAKTKVSNVIDRIKSLFNFSWSLPKLKLPHFSISGKFSLNPPQIPKFSIDWWAKGGIFTSPTLFGDGTHFNGVGEAGPEAVLPLNRSTLAGIGEGIVNSTSRLVDAIASQTNGGALVNVTMINNIASDYDSDQAIRRLDKGLGTLGVVTSRGKGRG